VTSVLFDFNGTVSDDEPLLCAIFQELFADAGKPLEESEYFDRLAGLSDPEIVIQWLGRPDPAVVDRKIARYRERAADGSTVDDETRRAVLFAAEHGPVAVVSGAARSEIEPVLAAAGLADAFEVIVAMEDVPRGKPEPDGYLRALELLGLRPEEAVAIEDSPPGVAAAQAAGLRCAALTRTFTAERLAGADLLAARVDRELIRRLVSSA
jgi:beta-phosphoglucomutase-like phosphatase (HAD superfamily)